MNLTRQIPQRSTKVSTLEELGAMKQNRAPQDSADAVMLKHRRCTVVGLAAEHFPVATHMASAGFRGAGGTFGLARKTFSGSYFDFNS